MPGAPVIDESLLLIEDDMTSYAYASPYMFVPCIVLVVMQSTSLLVYKSIPTRFNVTLWKQEMQRETRNKCADTWICRTGNQGMSYEHIKISNRLKSLHRSSPVLWTS